VNTKQELYELSKGFDIALDVVYDRLAPTISSKAKKLFGSGNKGQNNRGEAVPLSDGLDTRLCKILDPRLPVYVAIF